MDKNKMTVLPAHLIGEVWAEFGELTSPQTAAFNRLQTAYDNAANARQKIALDDTRTPQGKIFALHELYKKSVLPAAKAAHKSLDGVAKTYFDVQSNAWKALMPSSEGQSVALATEIRTTLRTMPEGERRAAIQSAMKAGDRQTIVAITTGPHYLSGLYEGETKDIRDQWLETHRPDLSADLEKAERIKRLAELAGPMLDEERMLAYIFDPSELAQVGIIVERRTAADVEVVKPAEPQIIIPSESRTQADADRGW